MRDLANAWARLMCAGAAAPRTGPAEGAPSGGLVELEHLRIRRWAHSLGFRGHILTKSRRYSTTYGALQEERADHRRGDAKPEGGPDTITESNWRYAGSGYTPGEADIALGIAEDLASLREIKRDMIAEGWRYAG